MKKVEVWVPRIVTGTFARAEMFTAKTRDMSDESWIKATLEFSLPEEKIEISRSILEQAWKDAKFGSGPDDFRENILKELFKK